MNQYRLLRQSECKIKDTFWSYYIQLIRDKVIPYQWEILNDRVEGSEPSHAIDNFKIAAKEKEGHFYGEIFQDSDLYKWLEAVGNILMLERDEELEEKADEVIALISRAQEEDGYLNTYFTIEAPHKKWTNVLECHELYCVGHFIEAAVSYYLATGKELVLETAIKAADCINGIFGPEEGKLHGYPGHQEIEIALLKLYDVTGYERYLVLAGYFIDTRGTNDFFEEEFEKRDRLCHWSQEKVKEPNRWYNQFPYYYYNQFHLPVRDQKDAVGHAVRGVYMYTAMADLASRNEDKSLWEACRNLWNSIVKKQLYITGGIGSTHSGEAFTVDYDLPNDTNYSETCASIGLLFFAQKMLKTDIDHIYGDVMEQVLYNTILGGMNYEGNRFFYVNPLEVIPETCAGNTERNHVKSVRQQWFACACCPPNIARTLGSLWQYIYTASSDTVFVHLYMGSEANIELGTDRLRANQLSVVQRTDYPWAGKITFDIKSDSSEKAQIAFRIPDWCKNYTLTMDGEKIEADKKEKGYIYLKNDWSQGCTVVLELEMVPQLIQANSKIHYDAGRVSMVRGPIVYCLEEEDNGKFLNQLSVEGKSPLREVPSELWNNSIFLQTKGYRKENKNCEASLYGIYESDEEETTITAVPYFLWNNRSAGEMQVWMRVKEK